ncbi:sn-glycerol-3-phosphate ABC transporter ATP-binding protein UgpC [uncultured Amaricoccus sp.]|uniref:ABC transporter ATP-binding protein n=1 Tax=uncultured Amaricoccus sp. TaxID=339341 RepID=UPI0026308E6E|nr:sn-glycerol-3-phosphate ABC transporter ATP-binding protein UgpC [uncultured Amaricoccus sp.]
MAVVELKKARKSYGPVDIIHDVDLRIEDGEFAVFVGPSGCGKSTLLRMIAGLETITGGEIAIDGQRVNQLDPAERGVAMVFQSYALYPHMTVKENMSFGLRIGKRPKAEIDERVGVASRILQLDALQDRRPSQLSGGQRQRVAIGRAIVRNPKVFLFDEPLSNLDAELRVQTRVEIAKLHESLGNTMIYVTHDQTEAMTLADKIVVLRKGRVEQVGPPLELYENPNDVFVAGFIGSPKMNFFAGKLETGGVVRFAGTEIAAPFAEGAAAPGAAVTIGIRPEHFDRDATPDAAIEIAVEFVEHLGGTSFVHGNLPDGARVIVERRDAGDLRSGMSIRAGFRNRDVRAFDAEGRRLR